MLKRLILVTVAIVGILGFVSAPAFAYVIDGFLTDWGIDLSAATNKGYLDSHLPSGGWDIDVITEDNAYSGSTWSTSVGPGYTQYNTFDAEAIYFDNDANNAYIAVITGLPKDGGTAPGNPWFFPGDIGIDVDLNGVYEFGINVLSNHVKNGTNTGTLYDPTHKKTPLFYGLTNGNWQDVYYPGFSVAGPWEIISGSSYLNPIDFAYSGDQNSHYVLEAKIPLSYLGLTANPGDPIKTIGLHWTMECGNDFGTLNADVNPVPEPATLSLLGLGLLGMLKFKKKVRVT